MTDRKQPEPIRAADLPPRTSTIYPKEFAKACEGRAKRALGNPLGLTAFGVNLVELAPGAASALRHWHTHEDEFVYVLDGEITLVSDAGEQVLSPGMCAGFPAGVSDGHNLINRSGRPATYLEVGSRVAEDDAHYPDLDLQILKRAQGGKFTRKDGTPYE
ncbi:MAG: cupin domain-containing protein [Alphaproteobacteria bacterium]|nr:cupin domain-containing protein [Alphaproteobacteria bacterium]